ncbi:hypothetical protein Taro_036770 [Colocasia esculenta]|uniref:Translocon-associated protein subunit alpha n=1 Tax=Colocasia esculenta TaxID=4460 RepID=A0A843WAS5_COLES|nr:hypothetical protein [Colocasia esculenta]
MPTFYSLRTQKSTRPFAESDTSPAVGNESPSAEPPQRARNHLRIGAWGAISPLPAPSMAAGVLFSCLLALLLLSSPLLQVGRCQLDADGDVPEVAAEGGNLGIVGDEFHNSGDGYISSAPGVDTTCVFPKNAARLVTAGEETELLVGMSNEGEANLRVLAIRASLHFPFDHHMLIQNLTVQEFFNASVPSSSQATFPYIFAVSKYLQPGSFDLVGTIFYEVEQHPFMSTFYNGTIEVVEAGGLFNIESVFLVTLGVALVSLLVLWAYGQIQNLSKKTKKAPKVEIGTGTTDASMDEWLQDN